MSVYTTNTTIKSRWSDQIIKFISLFIIIALISTENVLEENLEFIVNKFYKMLNNIS